VHPGLPGTEGVSSDEGRSRAEGGARTPEPSGPNSVPGPSHPIPCRSSRRSRCTKRGHWCDGLLVNVPPLSTIPGAYALSMALDRPARG
jgi:hypothetical protein